MFLDVVIARIDGLSSELPRPMVLRKALWEALRAAGGPDRIAIKGGIIREREREKEGKCLVQHLQRRTWEGRDYIQCRLAEAWKSMTEIYVGGRIVTQGSSNGLGAWWLFSEVVIVYGGVLAWVPRLIAVMVVSSQ